MSLQLTTLLLFLCVLSGHHAYNGAAVTFNSQEVELQAELKRLNKLPIKTITTKEGDIIDCININKQPALDHPLLKNHKVQTRPQSFPSGIREGPFGAATLELKSGREACPHGAVPMHRIRKGALLRAGSVSNGLPFNISATTNAAPKRNHTAFASAPVKDGGIYHGGGGRLSIYSPSVADDQTSGAIVWAQNNPADGLTNIVAGGWMVSPEENGDVLPRLFVYWTVDSAISTGCTNLRCPGFVQVDRLIGPKYVFSPASSYGGSQFDFGILVYKDQQTGNWWLAVTGQNEVLVPVGYWPKEILTALNKGASTVSWGGFVSAATDNKISPPMGSGHRPDGDYSHGCHFTDVLYVDPSNVAHPLTSALKFTDKPVCYGVEQGPSSWQGRSVGFGIIFGGPGGSCDE